MFQTSKSWFIFLVRRLKSGKFKQFSGVLYLFYKNPEYPQWLPYLKKKLSSSIIVLMIKLSNIATVLWQWKRELECESKKHCHDSVNNRKLENAVRIGLYCWVWAIEVCSFGGSMVRASDFNGTLKRREFEPRLCIFGFFFTFLYFSIQKLSFTIGTTFR